METYIPADREAHWRRFWDKEAIYSFKPKPKQHVFSIDTPPPTVSGRMHIGHAFSYSQGDFVARYRRMKGDAVFYPFGTDDNGLPTERLVERLKNVKGVQMERGAFVKLCQETLKEILPEFIEDWKVLGISCDFKSGYSTIDSHSIKTSQASFVDLFHKGRLYVEEAPVAWCPECQTAIAQAEFEDKEKNSTFNTLAFSFHDKGLLVGTTRPELLAACVALVVHPDDQRYTHFIGKSARVPIFEYDVPIISDEKTDPQKGTGMVMCCTFGDKVDIEWWRKHKLPLKVAITKDGRMNEEAKQYQGMKIEECRKKILADLKERGLLKEQKAITHVANVHERCGTPLEFLKTKQWFIKVLDKKEELIELADTVTWYPDFMKVRYIHWVENLQWDWCVSRQRFFGVPIPVWYCKKCGAIVVADARDLPLDPQEKKPKKACACGSKEFIPETDVLDTWATSAVTPQILLDWAEHPKKFEQGYPLTLRLQAHEIIRTWAFYSMVKGLYHHGKAPWKHILLSGYVQDPEGKKMSKSKGNVIAPQDIRKKYSGDAIRWAAAGMKPGEDMPFQEKEVIAGHRLVIKLWNAMRLVGEHIAAFKGSKPRNLAMMDRWVLSKLQHVSKRCGDAFETYSYHVGRQEIDSFFWHTFCDYYLEIVKRRLYDKNCEGHDSAVYAAYTVFLSTVKLLAPFVPFITEELYQQAYRRIEKEKSIHLSAWSDPAKEMISEEHEKIGDRFVEILDLVRKEKTKHGKGMSTPVALTLEKHDGELLKGCIEDLKGVCKASTLSVGQFSVQLLV